MSSRSRPSSSASRRARSMRSPATRDDRDGALPCAGPAQQRGDPGRQVLAGERLDHVVVGAVVEQPDDLRLLVPGGRDDDRGRGDRAHHLQRLAAVQVGEAEVEAR